MNLRSVATHALGAAFLLASVTLSSNAQAAGSAQANSATHVAAEMTKGKLNPAESKPGDTVALKLKDDVKSNGEVVLKKGTTITGVVRNVKQADAKASKGEAKGQALSMMEVEWLAPAAQGKAAQNLSIALQSVTQVNPIYQHEHSSSASDDFGFAGGGAASTAVARPVSNSGGQGGGLLGGVGGTLGATGGLATGAVGGVGSGVGSVSGAATPATRASGQSNVALLSMPSVVAVDHQTSSAIESSLGTASSGQLFKVGHGELVTAGGSQQSVDLFSHLSNDTVITSPGKNFEISSGAQMQLLVGVNRK